MLLDRDPPHGVCAWPMEDRLDMFEAQITGPEDSPYAKGTFKLRLEVPDRYPFEPPKLKFVTPIYHPNIDSGGRICLDTLKMPPKGSWSPSINFCTLLATVRLLMATPNANDGLMADITEQYTNDRAEFERVAKQWTAKHACGTAPSLVVGTTSETGGTGEGSTGGGDGEGSDMSNKEVIAENKNSSTDSKDDDGDVKVNKRISNEISSSDKSKSSSAPGGKSQESNEDTTSLNNHENGKESHAGKKRNNRFSLASRKKKQKDS